MYLDVDTECWREGSDMLDDADVVLQAHHPGEAVANGMLASVPGHPLWDEVIALLKKRRRKWLRADGLAEGQGRAEQHN